jgi:hypothetical protein
MKPPAKYVQPIHFEDFDGLQFERLVFAYHARTERWRSLEWYGQSGSDLGRDIWGVRDDGPEAGESVCVQCVNRANLTFAKVQADISKVLRASNGVPQRFRIVTRSKVSAAMRDKIRNYVVSKGVSQCDIWSGAEFEEFLRRGAESLLKRFIEGEAFPDAAPDLLTFALADGPLNDDDALALMAKLFDRPAFYTPIQQESNLGDFKQAITDTIQALGTEIWKARDGHLIGRIPSRQQLKDEALRKKVQAVEKALAKLRARFDELIRTGIISHCKCNDPDCPVYFMPHDAARTRPSFARVRLSCFAPRIMALKSHQRGDSVEFSTDAAHPTTL